MSQQQEVKQERPFGVVFPTDTIKRIDDARGKYMSRNKFMLKVIEEKLDILEASKKD